MTLHEPAEGMRTETAELVRQAAQRILENVSAGRIYDPETIEWAKRMVAGNAPKRDAA